MRLKYWPAYRAAPVSDVLIAGPDRVLQSDLIKWELILPPVVRRSAGWLLHSTVRSLQWCRVQTAAGWLIAGWLHHHISLALISYQCNQCKEKWVRVRIETAGRDYIAAPASLSTLALHCCTDRLGSKNIERFYQYSPCLSLKYNEKYFAIIF